MKEKKKHGGPRPGSGRPRIHKDNSQTHRFNVGRRYRRFLEVLGDRPKSPFAKGTRTFIDTCEKMIMSMDHYLAPYPDELEPLLSNLLMLYGVSRLERVMHIGGIHVAERGKPTSVKISPVQMSFLKKVGSGNRREGFRRLEDMIYTTLGSIDDPVMEKYPQYEEIWQLYKELFNAYVDSRHPGKMRKTARRKKGQ